MHAAASAQAGELLDERGGDELVVLAAQLNLRRALVNRSAEGWWGLMNVGGGLRR